MDQMKAAFVVGKRKVSFVKKGFHKGNCLLGGVDRKGMRNGGIRTASGGGVEGYVKPGAGHHVGVVLE